MKIIASIVGEVRPAVQGKHICIPEEMDYAFPTSEKQFTGPIPALSSLSLPENAVALSAALSAVRRASRPSHLVRSCEARRILGGEGTPVSHGTLRNLVRAGRLHTYGPNRWRLYSTAELEALMAPGEEGEA